MNIAYFLLPKVQVAYLYDDCSFRQGLEKMRHHGYQSIPVISRTGEYVGTVSEGDFLWHLVDFTREYNTGTSLRDLERLKVRDLLRPDRYPPVRITVSMEDLLAQAMNQNFIPVVDDSDCFIGIVTRNSVIRYLAEKRRKYKEIKKEMKDLKAKKD